TLAGNQGNGVTAGAGTVSYRNTIFAANAGGNVVNVGSASFVSLGHNLSSDVTGNLTALGDLPNTDPLLGPLQDNGGPTWTHALLPGSPAIDAGDNTDAPDFHQRGEGFARIVNKTIDIGAFEVQAGAGPRGGPNPHAPDRSFAADLVRALTRRAERADGFWAALPEDLRRP